MNRLMNGLGPAAGAALLVPAASAAPDALIYDRAAIARGEVWRLLTGNLVHLRTPHLLANLAGLLLLAVALRRRRGTGLCLAVSASAVGGGLFLLVPRLIRYDGLSGVLHGLLALLCADLVRHRRTAGLVLGALLLAKLAWELAAGPLPASTALAGGPVAVEAHLLGAASGLVCGIAQARPRPGGVIRRRRLVP